MSIVTVIGVSDQVKIDAASPMTSRAVSPHGVEIVPDQCAGLTRKGRSLLVCSVHLSGHACGEDQQQRCKCEVGCHRENSAIGKSLECGTVILNRS